MSTHLWRIIILKGCDSVEEFSRCITYNRIRKHIFLWQILNIEVGRGIFVD
jgi:hypothetical protein